MAELPKPSTLDSNQVLQYAFDDASRSLRTNVSIANATIQADTLAIEIDAADGDNVAISDGTNTAQVTSNKELKVKDFESLLKLASIDSKLATTLQVSDTLLLEKVALIATTFPTVEFKVNDLISQQKLTSIESKLSSIDGKLSTPELAVHDLSSLNKLAAIDAKLGLELNVKDTTSVAKLDEISYKLSNSQIQVNDSTSISKLTDINTKLGLELKVKDDAVIAKLTSIESKLTTPSSGGVSGALTPVISNVLLSQSGIEATINLPDGCKKYTLKVRNYSANLQVAFTQNTSNSNFITIPRGCSYSENFLELTTTYNKLYVQSNKNGTTVECIAWV